MKQWRYGLPFVSTALLMIAILALNWTAFAGSVPPQVVDQFTLKKWNGAYYASVRFPNGQTQELKSSEDLNYAGWQAKIQTAWDAIQNPPKPPDPITLDSATKEQLAERIKALGLTAKDLGL